jgi:transcriptional regulator with XRE-family HTH domain
VRAFPIGRASEPDRIINLKKFAQWMQDRRIKNGWSLEVLARHISQAGYPISQNKLYRIEQNLKEEGHQKRPLQTIDYELKIRLEDVLGDRFLTEEGEYDDLVSAKEVVELINDLAKVGTNINPPSNPALREIFEALNACVAAAGSAHG